MAIPVNENQIGFSAGARNGSGERSPFYWTIRNIFEQGAINLGSFLEFAAGLLTPMPQYSDLDPTERRSYFPSPTKASKLTLIAHVL